MRGLVKFYSYKTGKSHAKGGHTKFWGSIHIGTLSFSHAEAGGGGGGGLSFPSFTKGCEKFHPVLRGNPQYCNFGAPLPHN